MSDLTVPEVAGRLRCTTKTVYKLIHLPNGLRARKVASQWLISEQDLSDYVEAQENRRRRARRAS